MKRRGISLFLTLCMLVSVFTALPLTAAAAEGTCGDNLTWILDDNGTLTISGTGEMTNWAWNKNSPWYDNKNIKAVVIQKGVTSIGEYAFYKCSNLSSINIPNSVTSIESDTFNGCSNLVSINIPNSVTSIGRWAFEGCSSLSSINIPDSVVSIGNGAFAGCSSLVSINIPDKVTSIKFDTFSGCSSLSSINIPDSVTSIGYCAFYECSNLSSINIPDSVTSIEWGTFHGCSSLSNINIPSSVTSIGDSAFCDCNSLSSINIPNSVTSIGEGVFYHCSSLSSIYIPDSVTFIGGNAFSSCSSLSSINIPDSVTSIGEGAFEACNQLTDVYYAGSQEQWGKITIGNYNGSLINANIHYNYKPSPVDIPSSSSTSSGAPVIQSVTLKYNGKTYDLLTQPVNIEKGSNLTGTVSVKVNTNGNDNTTVVLTQGIGDEITVSSQCASGTVIVSGEINPGQQLSPGKDIYVLAADSVTQKTTSLKTKLLITEFASGEWNPSTGTEGLNFKLGKTVGFTVPDSVPVFGGTEIKWDFDFIPISVAYDKEDSNKINVVFGMNLISEDKDGRKYFSDFDFKGYKKGINHAARTQKHSLSDLKSYFMKDQGKKKNMNLFKGGLVGSGKGEKNGSLDVAGYAELKCVNGAWRFAEGQLCLNAEIEYTYQGQIFIWVVPLYYEFGGGVGGGLEGTMINVDPVHFTPEFDAYLTAKVSAKIGGGVGIAKVATAGAEGKGSLNIKTSLLRDYIKSWGEGSASFTVKVFGKTVAEKEFAKGEFLIYETGNNSGLLKSNAIKAQSGNDFYDQINVNRVYPNESRAYSEQAFTWLGEAHKPVLFSASYSGKNLTCLANHIYPESQPQLCEMNGSRVLIFTQDDNERTAGNKQKLVYSVYNPDSNTWSSPEAVWDDKTADFYPSVAGEYLVWQNQKSVMDDDMTLAEIGTQGEIVAAKWNGKGFDRPVSLTDNDELDALPRAAVNGTELTVAWMKNTENDIFGISGTSSIVKKTYRNSEWSEETVVKDQLPAVIDLAVGYRDDTLYLAYIPDGDGDIATLNDREIYCISDRETQITSNDVLDSHLIIQNGTLYWYSENNLYYRALNGTETKTVFEEGRHQLTEDFTVSQKDGDIAILWPGSKDDANEIMGVLSQDGAWGDVIEISDLGGQAKSPTAVIDGGKIITAFTSEVDGSTNLYALDLVPSYDIAIEGLDYNEAEQKLGEENTVEVTVKNNGELPIEQYSVGVYRQDGALIKSVEFTEPIKAGEIKTVSAVFDINIQNLPETLTVTVKISDVESDVTNNEATFTVGHADIDVTNITSYESLPSSTVAATVKNSGFSDAADITVSLRKESREGEVIDSKEIASLASGKEQEITFDYAPKEYENTRWYITAETPTEEISLGNNADYFINECAENLSDFEHSILTYKTADNTLFVNSFAANNTEKEVSGVVCIAVYSQSGQLKKISSQRLSLKAYSNTGVDVKIEGYEKAEGDIIKVFVWDGFDSLKPLTQAEVLRK